MNFTDTFIRRPVLASVISLLILFLGLRALYDLPLRQFPEMKTTVITVSTAYPGANAELIQGFITSPLQKAIATAEGIDYLTSQSMASVSTITAHIKLNHDPNAAMTDVMAKVSQVTDQLPKESNKPVINKTTGSTTDLMYIGFSSDTMTNPQITDYIARVIQPNLQTVNGVAEVTKFGGMIYAMRLWLNMEKMAALNVSTTDIINALQTQNFLTAAGQIKGNYVLFNISAKTDINSTKQFENIVVKSNKDALIRMKDIGEVELGSESYDSSVSFNGKTGVFIGIKATPAANPLTVIDDVKALLPELKKNYPPDLNSKVVYDSTEYIRSSIHEVKKSIIEASIIVIIVVFLFLGSIRSVVIPIVTIPLSLIGVCSLMLAMGYSLNLLTLLAMVLAIGLVVDDAIVVVENIYRHIEEGLPPFQAAIKGAHEIALPIIAMTITLAAVYAPIGFMTGITGALFKEFAFTLALAVIISGIIALTLSPMMSSLILNKNISQQRFVQFVDETFEKLKLMYQERLRLTLSIRPVVLTFAAIILVMCGLLAITTLTELAPEEDQSILMTVAKGPEYSNIDYLTKFTKQISEIYSSFPETQDYFVINGSGAVNVAFGGMILKPWNERSKSQKKLLVPLQNKLFKVAGLNAVSFPLPAIPGASGDLPIQFVITTTEDYTVINQVLLKLLDLARNSGLFLYVDGDLKFERPELMVDIDKNKAGVIGVNMQDIGTGLAVMYGGNYINRFNREGQSYKVIPQVPQIFRLNPARINDIYIPVSNQKQMVPLSSVVTSHIEVKPNQLNQFQQLNSATLKAIMIPGKSITQGLDFLRENAAEIFPMGVTYDYAGQSRQAIQEGNTMIYTFFFALIIIYLVLAAQFESFRDPLIVLISVPMSITGALIPLNIGFATLNIYSGIGLVTLIGLISKHGILMVDFANKLQAHENLSINEAILKASALRLRPILMTTAAMILGVIPLVLASGAGAASRFNIGLVISSGMLIGTCFTLFVVPAIYTLLAKNHSGKVSGII
ncbi:MAG: efflux RND transporter permease subunit [Gammaproteobacteria bacterium]